MVIFWCLVFFRKTSKEVPRRPIWPLFGILGFLFSEKFSLQVGKNAIICCEELNFPVVNFSKIEILSSFFPSMFSIIFVSRRFFHSSQPQSPPLPPPQSPPHVPPSGSPATPPASHPCAAPLPAGLQPSPPPPPSLSTAAPPPRLLLPAACRQAGVALSAVGLCDQSFSVQICCWRQLLWLCFFIWAVFFFCWWLFEIKCFVRNAPKCLKSLWASVGTQKISLSGDRVLSEHRCSYYYHSELSAVCFFSTSGLKVWVCSLHYK